jgi:hypothetical protein
MRDLYPGPSTGSREPLTDQPLELSTARRYSVALNLKIDYAGYRGDPRERASSEMSGEDPRPSIRAVRMWAALASGPEGPVSELSFQNSAGSGPGTPSRTVDSDREPNSARPGTRTGTQSDRDRDSAGSGTRPGTLTQPDRDSELSRARSVPTAALRRACQWRTASGHRSTAAGPTVRGAGSGTIRVAVPVILGAQRRSGHHRGASGRTGASLSRTGRDRPVTADNERPAIRDRQAGWYRGTSAQMCRPRVDSQRKQSNPYERDERPARSTADVVPEGTHRHS